MLGAARPRSSHELSAGALGASLDPSGDALGASLDPSGDTLVPFGGQHRLVPHGHARSRQNAGSTHGVRKSVNTRASRRRGGAPVAGRPKAVGAGLIAPANGLRARDPT